MNNDKSKQQINDEDDHMMTIIDPATGQPRRVPRRGYELREVSPNSTVNRPKGSPLNED
jgi:hypothetical protein